MSKFIGVLLLFYGVVGSFITLLVYWLLMWAGGPVQRLLRRLFGVFEILQRLTDLVHQSISLSRSVREIIQATHEQLNVMLPSIRGAAAFFNNAAGLIKDVSDKFDEPIPVLTPSSTSVPCFTLTVPVVRNVRLTKLGEIDGLRVYGPPTSVETYDFTLTVGPISVPWLDVSSAQPFRPSGQIFYRAGEEMEKAEPMIHEVETRVRLIKEQAERLTRTMDDLVETILAPLLQQLSKSVLILLDIAGSSLFRLLPWLMLAFFVMLHVAIALIGLALVVR